MSDRVWTEESATAAVARAFDTLAEVVALRAEVARLRRRNRALQLRLEFLRRAIRHVVKVTEHGTR